MSTELIVNVHLDWTSALHYDHDRSRPCRICTTVTKQRDNELRPCHKSCAEQELARELLGYGWQRIAGTQAGSPAAPRGDAR